MGNIRAVAFLSLLTTAQCYYTPISRPAERRLQALAREAVVNGNHRTALHCYQTATLHGSDGRSHLLLALHYQRMKRGTDAEHAFRQGVAHDRDNVQLLQAWALYESKHGNMKRAVRLLVRAAACDRSAIGALRWKIFRSYNQANNPLARPAKRGVAPRPLDGFDI